MNSKLLNTEAEQASTGENRQGSARSVKEFLPTMLLSILVGVFIIGTLIHLAGPWNVLANTRLLRLVIDSGFVKYHDRDAGFIEGLPDALYYLKAQEPVEWEVILLAASILMAFWMVEAWRFREIARYHGLSGNHTRAFLVGLSHRKFMPFFLGDTASASMLRADGATLQKAHSTLFLVRVFLIFSMGMFAIFGILAIGWTDWLVQLLVALLVLGVAYWWWKPMPAPEGGQVSVWAAFKEHLGHLLHRPARLSKLALISLVAFGMEDIVVYLLTNAFSTQQVLLHVGFELLLMAFVAGYTARLIPITPGGIGQFELAFVAVLFLGGVGLPEAVSVAVLYGIFYYLTYGIFHLATMTWRRGQLPLRTVVKLAYNPFAPLNGTADKAETAHPDEPDEDVLADTPEVPIPQMPAAAQLWRKSMVVAWVSLAIFFFDQITLLLSDFWLLESLGFSAVFWTNFSMGATLFLIGALAFTAAVALPAFVHPLSRQARRFALSLGLIAGLLAGYWLMQSYQEFLLLRGVPFGETDPVFGLDIGFYVFNLPALWIMWRVSLWLFLVALASSIACAYATRRDDSGTVSGSRVAHWLGTVATLPTRIVLIGLGLSIAVGVWLSRFSLLLQDGYATSVFTGASYIDVTGLFSTLNQIQITALIVLGVSIALAILLGSLHLRTLGRENSRSAHRAGLAGKAALALIVADFVFASAVGIRATLFVTPNQPVIQLPYMERHIEATRRAYNMDQIEEIEFIPRHGDDPLPSLEKIMSSGAMRNAPLWPTYATYLERLVDPQHAQRIIQTGGDNMIYGPSLENFRQQEKLRTYYDFLDVDVLRYTIDGERVVLASSVRELPILEPQPWLAWWGQRFMLFTHGHGLAMAPMGQVTTEGDPVFVSSQIPVSTAWTELAAENQRVYYGEGNASMAVSNVRDMTELDYPTNQGRAELFLPADVPAGVKVDSLLKRVVFGWRGGEFWEMVFSTLITDETRVHYFRQPMQRLQHVAPFLYFESNPYATIVDGEITWLVNAMTVSDFYPYSKHEYIGDKSVSRSPTTIETLRINYVEDSVKATINAATGQVQLYKIADNPIINSWAAIYPSLFTDGDDMPAEVRQQLTYPLHLFHIQFDDLYIYYHMNDPMYFFNMEDMWDDADEVLGPVMDQGKSITFSMEPYNMLVETGGVLPEAAEKEQFVMAMPYTPEGARNLRAIPMVYQDGEDYGRLFVLMVPKGLFITGPEQADAIIDQDPDISEKISWWNRLGTEVIRGHTSLLIIDNEVVYVEPIFIRSTQNTITQLKRVVVVMRGQAYMHETLEQALEMAYDEIGVEVLATSP